MIKVTENAKLKALELMNEDNAKNSFIRVGVKGGGCSGLMYELKFDHIIQENDKSFTEHVVVVKVFHYKLDKCPTLKKS